MNQNLKEVEWALPSGLWQKEESTGFKLKSRGNITVSNKIVQIKQFLNLPYSQNNEFFPPEFKFHPDTGVELIPAKEILQNNYWLGAYGNRVSELTQDTVENGLQLCSKLSPLANNSLDISNVAENELKFELAGNFEFLSVLVGVDFPQLIALNKSEGDLYLFNELTQAWMQLDPKGLRLAACSEQLLQSWQAVSFLSPDHSLTHEIYLPTEKGLARLTIQGLELIYRVEYLFPEGSCLGAPVFWKKCLVVPMYIKEKVVVVDIYNRQVIDVIDHQLTTKLYFEKVVYKSNTLIWIGKTGQLILNVDVESTLHANYQQWLPSMKPDFRFGAPYLDRSGKFYQLSEDYDGHWFYVELNCKGDSRPQKTAFRFTTGRTKYSFQNALQETQDIWEELKHSHSVDNQSIVVPLIEDVDNKRILGFRFVGDNSESIIDKLNNTDPQDIVLFLSSYDQSGDIHQVQVKKPLESRFFYHDNKLYFYNPNLKTLLGWEVQP